jgi:ABC-type transport system involved in multi-copper enzyme maturation permease subunit
MLAVVRREFRRNTPLLILAPVVSLIVAAIMAYATSRSGYPRAASDDAAALGGVVILVVLAVTAALAGAGVFARDRESGMLTELLLLPLSRRELWLAKLIGGGVAVTASLCLLAAPLIGGMHHRRPWTIWEALTYVVPIGLLLFASAVFCSTFSRASVIALTASFPLAWFLGNCMILVGLAIRDERSGIPILACSMIAIAVSLLGGSLAGFSLYGSERERWMVPAGLVVTVTGVVVSQFMLAFLACLTYPAT